MFVMPMCRCRMCYSYKYGTIGISTVLNNEGQSRLTNDSQGSIGNNANTYKVTAHRPPTKTIQHSDVPNKGVIIEKSIMINNAGYIVKKSNFMEGNTPKPIRISSRLYRVGRTKRKCYNVQ